MMDPTRQQASSEKTIKPDSQATAIGRPPQPLVSESDWQISEALRNNDRFVLKRQLGSGGFGVVWQAFDTQLKRIVALKVPHPRSFDEDLKARFAREAQAAARLNHDGIVSVFDVSSIQSGLPIIVSQFVDGPSLAEYKQQEKIFSGREAATLCADLADALSHAHASGVVHRDLKPSNVLIDCDGKAYLTDFGLAKDLQNDDLVTSDGAILGTAAYMAPEQAAGLGREADARCDIYSLGVMLYEMVTGERPFRGTIQMLLLQVINDPPLPPQRLNAAVDLDLQTIILNCMEKATRIPLSNRVGPARRPAAFCELRTHSGTSTHVVGAILEMVSGSRH